MKPCSSRPFQLPSPSCTMDSVNCKAIACLGCLLHSNSPSTLALLRIFPLPIYALLPLESLKCFGEHDTTRGILLHARSVDYCKGSEAKMAVQLKKEGVVLCAREVQSAAPPLIISLQLSHARL